LAYVPFSTSDFYNWKTQNQPFSEKPQLLISLIELVFRTPLLTWDDCQQSLLSLFTAEKQNRIRFEVKKVLLGGHSEEQAHKLLKQGFPSEQPEWDPNSSGGRQALVTFHQNLLNGIWAAAWKPINLSVLCHPFQPGDIVFIKAFWSEGLTPAWKRHYTVILTMLSALKVEGILTCVHYSLIKQVKQWTAERGPNLLKLRLVRS
ncbi:Gag polyprotein, partial [Heterocephalus glaber]